ncbi:unnamed protein product [Darwinula stevensoni]|uniref:Uncharacterized protein n=1 Tax=Darwinula stevensoni TaxID=69355 RepID=A0A7R9AG80_9CRUS|nr:unnamed protein product [Darwinula stevensoni]CAG0904039.1 unnamed protein product [Darwinula stevensoni]
MNILLLVSLLVLSASTVICKQCYSCQGTDGCNLDSRHWDVVNCDGDDDHLGLPQGGQRSLEPDERDRYCFSSWRDREECVLRDEHVTDCFCKEDLCNDEGNKNVEEGKLECYRCDDEDQCGRNITLWATERCDGDLQTNGWHCASLWKDGKLKKARCGLSTGPGCFYDPDRDDDDMICYCNSTLCNDKDNHGFPPDSLECYDCDDEKECGDDVALWSTQKCVGPTPGGNQWHCSSEWQDGKLKKARCGLSTGPGCFYDPDRDDDDMICYCNSTLCNDKDNHGFPPDSLECYDCDDEKECGQDVALWRSPHEAGCLPWTKKECVQDEDRDDDTICFCQTDLCNDKNNKDDDDDDDDGSAIVKPSFLLAFLVLCPILAYQHLLLHS